MEFRVEEKGELLHLHPVVSSKWMLVRGHGSAPWKLYKRVGSTEEFAYMDEYVKFDTACEAGKGL